MSPHEKAVNAINVRLERLQVNLRAAGGDEARYLFQSIVMLIGLTDALNDYVEKVGAHVRRRHDALKRSAEDSTAKHAALLQSGQELLEKFRANPADRVLRQEIAQLQRAMEDIQKQMRREGDGLQKELAPAVAMIDEVALTVRRFGESEQPDVLKRTLRTVIGQTRELVAANRALPKGLLDSEAWEAAAVADVDRAAGFQDAYARAVFQSILALEWMALTVAENPPASGDEAASRADLAAAERVKAVTARLGNPA